MSKSKLTGVGRGLAEYQRAAIEQAITAHSGVQGLGAQFERIGSLATSWGNFARRVMTEITPAISPYASITNTSTSLQSDIINTSGAREMLVEQSISRLHRQGQPPKVIVIDEAGSYDDWWRRTLANKQITANKFTFGGRASAKERTLQEQIVFWLDEYIGLEEPELWHYRLWRRRQQNIPPLLRLRILPVLSLRRVLGVSAAWHHLDDQQAGYFGVVGDDAERRFSTGASPSGIIEAPDRRRDMRSQWLQPDIVGRRKRRMWR